jgi:hypothetical protein
MEDLERMLVLRFEPCGPRRLPGPESAHASRRLPSMDHTVLLLDVGVHDIRFSGVHIAVILEVSFSPCCWLRLVTAASGRI